MSSEYIYHIANNSSIIEYRYYQCHMSGINLKCKQIENPYILPDKPNTKLEVINSYIPKCLDKHILKYKWMPDKVFIEN